MTRILVAGIGSPHQEDSAGWFVIDKLKPQIPEAIAPRIVLAKLQTPLDLLDFVDHQATDSDRSDPGYCAWILIDACLGLASGHAHRWIWPEIPSDYSNKASTHALGLLDAVKLAETLGVLPGELSIYGVGIKDLSCSIDACIAMLGYHIDQLLA